MSESTENRGHISLTTDQSLALSPLMQGLKDQGDGAIMGQLLYDENGDNLSIYLRLVTEDKVNQIADITGTPKTTSQYISAEAVFNEGILRDQEKPCTTPT